MFAALLTQIAGPSSSQGLTLQDFLEDLPTDPASLFVVVLAVGAFVAVVWFGRRRPRSGGPTASA